MLVNVTYLRIEANEKFITLRPVNEEMVEMAESQGKKWLASPRHLVLSREETEMAIKCCRGVAPFYPFFDDGIHLVKFHPHGLREVYLDGAGHQSFWFTIPGRWLAERLEDALSFTYTLEEPWEYEARASTLEAIKEEYGPIIAWDHAEGVFEKLCADLHDERCKRLQVSLDRLLAIAENHSDGEVVTIGLRFDHRPESGVPASYYFWITQADGQRIINGGIIAHRNRRYDEDKDGKAVAVMLDSWEYSTHT